MGDKICALRTVEVFNLNSVDKKWLSIPCTRVLKTDLKDESGCRYVDTKYCTGIYSTIEGTVGKLEEISV